MEQGRDYSEQAGRADSRMADRAGRGKSLAEAETRLQGARKPYPSNLAKVLGLTLPESLKRTENAAARQKLAELRRMLDERRG